ncbi:hypothetical protein HOY80DRAFT_1059109 [Tuber brumale]|nr:hypothetical protein HOY80DRAFT_1059109 [Tuber brumale]
MNETCALTITHEETTWENCCPGTIPETASTSCPPILQNWHKCPTPYTNCADPSSHREMCSASLSGYTDSRSLNRKCCPTGYACGGTYTAPCVLQAGNVTQGGEGEVEVVHTNPQYIATPAVFAGCDDASALSPAAVGGIVAVGVVSFCFLCGVLLWWIRRRLYRDPGRPSYWRTGERGGAGVSGRISALGIGDMGIRITKEFKVEEKKDEDAAGMEAGGKRRTSGDSTARMVSDDMTAVGDDGGSGEPPPEGMSWAAAADGERGRSEDTITLISSRY